MIVCALLKPATSDYIVKDTGNCSPRYIRCTINQVVSYLQDCFPLLSVKLFIVVYSPPMGNSYDYELLFLN